MNTFLICVNVTICFCTYLCDHCFQEQFSRHTSVLGVFQNSVFQRSRFYTVTAFLTRAYRAMLALVNTTLCLVYV